MIKSKKPKNIVKNRWNCVEFFMCAWESVYVVGYSWVLLCVDV